ncbi:hypothetical protein D3C80_2178520 [compost metagenome]
MQSDRQPLQRLVQFGDSLAGGQPAKVATLVLRWASRMPLSQFGEAFGVLGEFA